MDKIKKNRKVSVIVPVFNAKKYLSRCIRSLLKQTYKDIQIVLVDDGSNDGSSEICDSFGEKYANVKVMHINNSGAGIARNVGIDNADGYYTMFVDADDWIDDKCISECIKYFNEISNLDCVMFPYIREFKNYSASEYTLGKENRFFIGNATNNVYRRLFGLVGIEKNNPASLNDLNPSCCKMFLSKHLDGVRYPKTETIISGEDCWFNVLLLRKFKAIQYIATGFYHYDKENTDSVVHTYQDTLINQYNELYRFMEKIIQENKLDDTFYEALNNRKVFSMLNLIRNIYRASFPVYEKYRLIDELLNTEYVKVWFDKFSFEFISVKWKVYFWLCKKRCTIGVYLISIIGEYFKRYLR